MTEEIKEPYRIVAYSCNLETRWFEVTLAQTNGSYILPKFSFPDEERGMLFIASLIKKGILEECLGIEIHKS